MSQEDTSTVEDASVAGKAPETVSGDDYADMIAAVDAAKAGQDVPVKPAEAKATPAPAPEPEKPKEEELPAITAAIRKRDAEQKAREAERTAAKTEAERIKEETITSAKAEAQRVADEILAKAKAEAEQFHRTLREKPLEAIKGAGWDPDRLVNEVVQAGDPAYQRARALEAQIEAIKAENNEIKTWKQQQVEQQKQREEYDRQQHRIQTLNSFAKLGMETAPHLKAMAEEAAKKYGPLIPNMQRPEDWIMLWGDHAHSQAVQATGQGVANMADLIQHLDYQARSLGLEPSNPQTTGTQGGAQKPGKNGATSQRAQGPRTLNASTATERRASPKPPSEMTEAEIRASMEAAARDAMNQQR